MNLYHLFQAIPARIDYMNGEAYKGNKPTIRVYDEEQETEIVFNNMFNSQQYLLFDMRTLANIWDKLLKDDDQTSLDDKYEEIAEFLGGKRYRNDVLTMIHWLRNECDIDNEELIGMMSGS